MFKSAFATLILLIATACSCAAPVLKPSATEVVEMMDSTVRIRTIFSGPLVTQTPKGIIVGDRVEGGSVGTGVVISKTSGALGPITSRIMTAQHVAELPALGALVDFPADENGPRLMLVDHVEFRVITRDGAECLPSLFWNGSDTDLNDVAIVEVKCDAGRPADLLGHLPAFGSAVIAVGHPYGSDVAAVTEGYLSGWDSDGYVQTSAQIAPGSSGGGLWYQGELIGITVRVNRNAHQICLSIGPVTMAARVFESKVNAGVAYSGE